MGLGCLQSGRSGAGQADRQHNGRKYELRGTRRAPLRRGLSGRGISRSASGILLAKAFAARYESGSMDDVQSGTDKMKETAQQYIQRITSYVEGEQLLEVQSATSKKLERLIRGVPASKLRKRPAADKWSVSEILAHLADTELVGGFRMRLILGAAGPPGVGVDKESRGVSGYEHKRNHWKSCERVLW